MEASEGPVRPSKMTRCGVKLWSGGPGILSVAQVELLLELVRFFSWPFTEDRLIYYSRRAYFYVNPPFSLNVAHTYRKRRSCHPKKSW